MTPIQRFRAGKEVRWSEFNTIGSRIELYAEMRGDHIDDNYVSWVDTMNMRHFPDRKFTK